MSILFKIIQNIELKSKFTCHKSAEIHIRDAWYIDEMGELKSERQGRKKDFRRQFPVDSFRFFALALSREKMPTSRGLGAGRRGGGGGVRGEDRVRRIYIYIRT